MGQNGQKAPLKFISHLCVQSFTQSTAKNIKCEKIKWMIVVSGNEIMLGYKS